MSVTKERPSTHHDSYTPTAEQFTTYDFTVIAAMDTLIGVNCLDLAYRATQFNLHTAQHKPKYKIQLLGVQGGWNANLDSSVLYSINTQWLDTLGKSKQNGEPDYAKWRELQGPAVQLPDILAKTVILCLPEGTMAKHALSHKSIVNLSSEALSPLEALSDWLNEPLLAIEAAHATYHRDYLPGLAFHGIPFDSSAASDRHPPIPTVSSILKSAQQFEARDIPNIELDTTQHWCGLPLATEAATREESKCKKDVCLYLVDEQQLELQHNGRLYNHYKDCFLETLDREYCQAKYQEAVDKHNHLIMPTNLVLYCAKLNNQDDHNTLDQQLQRVERIEFTSCKNNKQALLELANLPELSGLADIKVISGTFSHYFRAEITHKGQSKGISIVDLIVDHLLAICLDRERPQVSYGSTFFLPFRLAEHSCSLKYNSGAEPYAPLSKISTPQTNNNFREKTERYCKMYQLAENEDERFNLIANERDAFLYLDPVIRERLFILKNNSAERIEEWRASISPDAELAWLVDPNSQQQNHYIWAMHATPYEINLPVAATVRDVKLHHFYNDVYILSVNVYERFFQGKSSLTSTSHNWWHDLFSQDSATQHTIERSRIKHWLTYTDKIRQLYPSFATREKDKNQSTKFYFGLKSEADQHTFTSREIDYEQLAEGRYRLPNDFLNIMKVLNVTAPEDLNFKAFIDNRLFINTIYGLAGDPLINPNCKAKYEALYALAAFADDDNKACSTLGGYAYDPTFTQDLLNDQSYMRWAAMGNRYAFTNYSNVYVGYGAVFNNDIAPCHVFYNYQYMLLLALFYRESLHDFSEQISEISERIDTVSKRDFQVIRQNFIRFTNVSWFQDCSSQIQGKEIYQKIMHGLGIDKEYQFLEKEISTAYQHFQAASAGLFTLLSFVFAIATLFGGAYTLYFDAHQLAPDTSTITPFGAPIILAILLFAITLKNRIFNLLVQPNKMLQHTKRRITRRTCGYWLIVLFILGNVAWATDLYLYLWSIVNG